MASQNPEQLNADKITEKAQQIVINDGESCINGWSRVWELKVNTVGVKIKGGFSL